jgi:hypothetical protein
MLTARRAEKRREMGTRLRSPYVGFAVSLVGFAVGGITLLSGRRRSSRRFFF